MGEWSDPVPIWFTPSADGRGAWIRLALVVEEVIGRARSAGRCRGIRMDICVRGWCCCRRSRLVVRGRYWLITCGGLRICSCGYECCKL